MSLTKAQASTILTRLGFRVNTSSRYNQAIKNFQKGWYLGAALVVDGAKGSKTDSALLLSEARRVKGLGTAAEHFSFAEMACKCGGRYTDCQRIWADRSVFASLEASRKKLGRPISITSGCRCPNHNRAVSGASNSMHLYGLAVDWRGPDKDITRSWRLWRGIGYGGRSDVSLHTDLRPTASVLSPTTWIYSNS
jgi:zinc D-Ala-D-Ala carboxypeptidase